MFAAQLGAKKVYAVEASEMAHNIRKVAQDNNLQEVVQVLHGKVEEVSFKLYAPCYNCTPPLPNGAINVTL